MTELFLKVFNLSLSGSWLVLAVLAARMLLKKAPRWVHVLLWALVAVRLLCPFSLESALSLIPSAQVVNPQIMLDAAPAINTGIPAVNAAVNPVISEVFAPAPETSANPLQIWLPILAVLWILGMAAMGEYTLFTYARLTRQVRTAIRVKDNLYLCDTIDSPFVLGVLRPRIYLPFGMSDSDMAHVLAHEKCHIRRRDHLWKPLGFLLLSIHWFNPLMWIACLCLCRDIELACDEKVVRDLGMEQRADYSQALLNCAVRHKYVAACPIAFGEVGVKARVKNALFYRRPASWVLVIALALCLFLAVCFLTDPKGSLADRVIREDGYRILWEAEESHTLAVPRFDLPMDCYTREGHEFPEMRYPLAHFRGSSIYLKHVGLADETEEYLRFTFSIHYDDGAETLLLPCSVTDSGGTVATLSLPSSEVSVGGTGLEDVTRLASVGPGQDFAIDIRWTAWTMAMEDLMFPVNGFRRVTFVKESLLGDVDPRPIVHNLMPQHIQWAEAVFLLDGRSHLELDRTQISQLANSLYWLSQKDFQPARPLEPTISLTAACGDREMRLDYDGQAVAFSFDDRTASQLDGAWMTQDEELLEFFGALHTGTSALSFYGVSISLEEVSPTGATLLFHQEGAPADGRLLGGNDYTLLRIREDGTLETVYSEPEANFTFTSYDISNIRRHSIDWQWRYGYLPPGNYRIGKTVTLQRGTNNQEQGMVWADFVIGQEALDSTYEIFNVAPLEDIPDSYTLEEAQIDNVVIFIGGDITANQEVWADFLNRVNSGVTAWVRLMHYHEADNKALYDLSFDGEGYLLSWMEDGRRYTEKYAYLRHFSGEAREESAYDAYDYYALTDHPDTTWEELVSSAASSLYGALIPFRLVYMDHIYQPKQPQLPYAAAAELRQDDNVLGIYTEERQIHELWYLMQQAVWLGYEPKTFCEGPQLIFTAENGVTHTVTLSLDTDLIFYNGMYYDFCPGTDENGNLNGLPQLLALLGFEEDWPQEVKEAYPAFFGPDPEPAPRPSNNIFQPDSREGFTVTVRYPDGEEVSISEAGGMELIKVLSETALELSQEELSFSGALYTLSIDYADGSGYRITDFGDGEFRVYDANEKLLYRLTNPFLDNDIARAIRDSA